MLEHPNGNINILKLISTLDSSWSQIQSNWYNFPKSVATILKVKIQQSIILTICIWMVVISLEALKAALIWSVRCKVPYCSKKRGPSNYWAIRRNLSRLAIKCIFPAAPEVGNGRFCIHFKGGGRRDGGACASSAASSSLSFPNSLSASLSLERQGVKLKNCGRELKLRGLRERASELLALVSCN